MLADLAAVYAGPPDIVMDDVEQQQGDAGAFNQAAGVKQRRP
jgi:hypothetical protein